MCQSLKSLQDKLSRIKEIRPIGKTASVHGFLCHVMGLLLSADQTLQMLILQYDEEKPGQADGNLLTGRPVTNRIRLRAGFRPAREPSFFNVERVCLGRMELSVCQIGGSKEQWESSPLPRCLWFS